MHKIVRVIFRSKKTDCYYIKSFRHPICKFAKCICYATRVLAACEHDTNFNTVCSKSLIMKLGPDGSVGDTLPVWVHHPMCRRPLHPHWFLVAPRNCGSLYIPPLIFSTGRLTDLTTCRCIPRRVDDLRWTVWSWCQTTRLEPRVDSGISYLHFYKKYN